MRRVARLMAVFALLLTSCTSESEPAAGANEQPLQAGIVECGDLWQSGDQVVQPTVSRETFAKIARELAPMMGLPPNGSIVELGSGESVYGRVHVVLPFRDEAALARILAIDERLADGKGVCVELPPEGYYDQPLPSTTWELLEPDLLNLAENAGARIAVGGDCGGGLSVRMRDPVVTETPTGVSIDIKLDQAMWGVADDLVCATPPTLFVEFEAPLAGRALTGCGHDDCLEGVEPVGTPAPVPPVMRNIDTAMLLQQLLVDAGFSDIGLDHPIDPTAVAGGTWMGQTYTIGLYQGDFRPELATTTVIECSIGGLSFDTTLPADAEDSLRAAANC